MRSAVSGSVLSRMPAWKYVHSVVGTPRTLPVGNERTCQPWNVQIFSWPT